MRRILVVLSLCGAAFLSHPGASAAQCNEKCITLFEREVAVGFGCITEPGSNQRNCRAGNRSCLTDVCFTAFVVSREWTVLAAFGRCDGKPDVTGVVVAAKSAGTASRLGEPHASEPALAFAARPSKAVVGKRR